MVGCTTRSKNLFGSEVTWESIRDEKTVGIINQDQGRGTYEVATPVGVVAGIVPTTNPTSTAIFKSQMSNIQLRKRQKMTWK